MSDQQITEQSLHLLLDGELDPMSRKLLLQRMESDPALQEQYKRLQEMREMMAFAYGQEAPRENKPVTRSTASSNISVWKARWPAGLAASLVLSIGLSTGWLAHDYYQQEFPVVINSASAPETKLPRLAASQLSQDETRKYMIHMSAFDEKRSSKAFLETESILDSYAKSGLPVKLDLLINHQGVQLFDSKNVEQLKRIRHLINSYDNVNFYACSKSLKLFMQGTDLPTELPQVHSDQIVEEIIPERINEGWVYLKV